MTLDQLRVFVAVAEREHLTEGAKALRLAPSAATAAIQSLEGRYGAKLFHRIGRRLELSDHGRAFLAPARAALGAAKAAEIALQEMGGVAHGRLAVAASQTLASHWLPPLLMRFAAAYRNVELDLSEGNTAGVVARVLAGEAELGCIEGEIDEPALALTPLADDRLLVVAAPRHRLARQKGVMPRDLEESPWVMREEGSGTRAIFEAALRAAGMPPEKLSVLLTLPTNEALCGAVMDSPCLTVVSELVARAHLEAGRLCRVDYALPPRKFALVHHKERFRTKASFAFEALLREEAQAIVKRQSLPDYDI